MFLCRDLCQGFVWQAHGFCRYRHQKRRIIICAQSSTKPFQQLEEPRITPMHGRITRPLAPSSSSTTLTLPLLLRTRAYTGTSSTTTLSTRTPRPTRPSHTLPTHTFLALPSSPRTSRLTGLLPRHRRVVIRQIRHMRRSIRPPLHIRRCVRRSGRCVEAGDDGLEVQACLGD